MIVEYHLQNQPNRRTQATSSLRTASLRLFPCLPHCYSIALRVRLHVFDFIFPSHHHARKRKRSKGAKLPPWDDPAPTHELSDGVGIRGIPPTFRRGVAIMLAFAWFGPIAILTNLGPSKKSLELIIHKVPLFLGCAPNFGED